MDSPPERFLVGLIGAGIRASVSPLLHEREGDELGLRCLYQLVDLDELGLEPRALGSLLEEARRMGFAGLNLTHPCKQVALDYLDELSPTARVLGAVNTVLFSEGRVIGHNTDCAGFAQSFSRGLSDARRERVVLLGAGGAGAAVAHAALGLGTERLIIADEQPKRAWQLSRSLAARFGHDRVIATNGDSLDLTDADGLIHATPTGMASLPGVPLPLELLHPALWVADIVYMPLETELLRYARGIGCRTLNGGGMVVFQAADSFQLFTGRQPDHERMLRHFATLTGSVAEPAWS
jgi:shikimate dehydrogenase